jgi:hypothetical protein
LSRRFLGDPEHAFAFVEEWEHDSGFGGPNLKGLVIGELTGVRQCPLEEGRLAVYPCRVRVDRDRDEAGRLGRGPRDHEAGRVPPKW